MRNIKGSSLFVRYVAFEWMELLEPLKSGGLDDSFIGIKDFLLTTHMNDPRGIHSIFRVDLCLHTCYIM